MEQHKVKMASTAQVRAIQVTLRAKNLVFLKPNLLHDFSNGRAKHVNELTSREALELLRTLNNQPLEKSNTEKESIKDKENTMRRKMIALCHNMGWYLEGTKNIDYKRLDDWCEKYGKYHKVLKAHTVAELPILISQFEKLYEGHLKNFANH